MGPKGPLAGAEGCNPPQELEKAREAGYFSSVFIFLAFWVKVKNNEPASRAREGQLKPIAPLAASSDLRAGFH